MNKYKNIMDEQILEKWKDLINACKSYYIDSLPTGFSDSDYDEMEKRAIEEDNFYVRDYIFDKFLKGSKYKNSYIEKIKKTKVNSTMLDAIKVFNEKIDKTLYCDLKYDGSSLAIYIDSETGIPKRIVTVGNLNLNDYGVDQTWKLMDFIPKKFPRGIVAIQAEALIDLDRLGENDEPERARQKANGLINSKNCEEEVNNLLTLRAYRYYTDDSLEGQSIRNTDYRTVLKTFDTVYSPIDNHILFAPADNFTVEELEKKVGFCETDKTRTSTGLFLNDGWVMYDDRGTCLGALKYSGAGIGDVITKTTVRGIKWNNQVSKGKDSWSANVLIDPVIIKGATCTKPSAGSVNKLVKNKISSGAVVNLFLANSTIPTVGEVYSPGNGNYQWPVCSCGYSMSEVDIYGSNLKCGNPMCTERLERMKKYLKGLSDIHLELDLNKFLVIDRFKWENQDINIDKLLNYVEDIDYSGYKDYLMSYMTTDLQKKNMKLVVKVSFMALRDAYENKY